MRFNRSTIDLIKERTSWRTYDPRPLEEDLRKSLEELLELKDIKSPFADRAGKCRFELIGMPDFDPDEKKKIGTHGIIHGAQDFIVGAIEKSQSHSREHYGYMMEYLILGATDLGLGTCWLGGFFNKSLFGLKINVSPNEIMPAITSTGYPQKRRKMEVLGRKAIKADKRYPWERLFFEGDFSKPLVQEDGDKHATLIEMVRLGPSAGNKQSWRIVKEGDRNIFHFYHIKLTGGYSVFPPIDIGIACCHFQLTAEELGIKGKWEFSQPDISTEHEYKITWIGE
jgi:nitroreductase